VTDVAPSASRPLLRDPSFPRLKAMVIEATGLAYYADKDAALADHVADRLRTLGVADCAGYLDLLSGGDAARVELDALLLKLTIGETYFFRGPEHFQALREVVLPDVLARNEPRRRLRIWSAGCAVGAEPYSIAILLRRDLSHRLAGWDVAITATDVNREALAGAREGRFTAWHLRGVPETVRRSCFLREGDLWAIAPEYKRDVVPLYHNLAADIFPSLAHGLVGFDVILCRNVLIYFAAHVTRRLIAQFTEALVPGGWLIIGHAEVDPAALRGLESVSVPGATLFRRRATLAAPAPPPASAAAERSWTPPDIAPLRAPARERRRPPGSTPVPTPPRVPAPPVAEHEIATVRALADRGAWEAALARCDELQARHGLTPSLYFYRGLVLEQMGRYEEAERALQRTIYLDRAFPLAHYCLGLLLQRIGDRPAAARTLRNAIELLSRMGGDRAVPDGDGITARDLHRLARRQLEALRAE
jgi:chemotaxis protein methyltransferase CheR